MNKKSINFGKRNDKVRSQKIKKTTSLNRPNAHYRESRSLDREEGNLKPQKGPENSENQSFDPGER